MFDIGKGTNTPITGLEYHKIPGKDKYFVLVTTSNRLYHFVGHSNSDDKPLLQQVFNGYLSKPEKNYYEISCKSKCSKLKFLHDKHTMTPKAFGWMTEAGIFYSELNTSNMDNFEMIKENHEMISFPKPMYEDLSKSQKTPVAFALTEFHSLLAYTNLIKGVSVLNKELVVEDSYNEAFGKLINIVKDPSKGKFDRSTFLPTEITVCIY